MNNVIKEFELYAPMVKWLRQYLVDKVTRNVQEIIVVDAHAWTLDSILASYDALQYYPQVVGTGIEIDILGMVKYANKIDLYFIEAKKTALTLRDLGQLWAYCKLCSPKEAFLLSSKSLGTLDKLLNNLSREDLLDFGSGKLVQKMQVAVWDVSRNTIIQQSLIPKI